MKVLVARDRGYIGAILVPHLGTLEAEQQPTRQRRRDQEGNWRAFSTVNVRRWGCWTAKRGQGYL